MSKKREFTKDEIQMIRKSFKAYDTDGNGVIEKPELVKAMKDVGLKDEEINEVVNEFLRTHDYDGDGKVTWEEFLKTFDDE